MQFCSWSSRLHPSSEFLLLTGSQRSSVPNCKQPRFNFGLLTDGGSQTTPRLSFSCSLPLISSHNASLQERPLWPRQPFSRQAERGQKHTHMMTRRHKLSEITSRYFSEDAPSDRVSGVSSPSARVSLCLHQQLGVGSANSRRWILFLHTAALILYNVGR